ncbi:MAG: tetratricopeptide repeat protein [Deltaproteobacteria bacterium]|nr:tetratricopeptide repeat protein [Deltaproteobacteria bacterium]
MRHLLVALAIAAPGGGLAAGCASAREAVADPPLIERLRLAITKTRHAIGETRAAIARSRGSPLLPELYVRLAELLSEEARYHNQVAYEREERKSRLIHAPQVQLLKHQAIAVYREVLQRFPATPLAPQVRFNIGHEHRELGEFPEMVSVLEELVAAHPDSPLADEALLVLGDYHFDKAELERAGDEYTAITKRPLSRVSSLGQYKLAWVHVNLGQCKPALAAFEAALDASAAWATAGAEAGPARADDDAPAAAQSIDVRREALVDLVYCYTQERDPMEAAAYLRARAANRAAYVAALRRMADRLTFIARPDAGLPVARELLGLAPADDDRLDDARVLYAFLRHELRPEGAAAGAGAAAAPKPTTPAAPGPGGQPLGPPKPGPARAPRFLFRAADVRMLTEAVLRWAQRPGTGEELQASTREEFERMARDLLTNAQERAQELPAGDLRTRALSEVGDGYLVYLDAFPGSPERLAMVKNLVDTLSLAGRHLEAGMQALAAAGIEGDPATRQATLLDGVSELQRALEIEGPRRPTARFVARAALRRAGLALLDNHREAPLPGDKLRVVKLAVALTYFDEGRFREAIDRLTALAYEQPGSEEGTTALFLALDAYDALGDHDGLIALGHRFLAPQSPAGDAARARIAPAVARAEQNKLDALALSAAGSGGAELADLERFGARFAGTRLGERALVNAFVAARALGDGAALQRLGEEIVTKYPGSDQVTGVITTMARSALASLDYDRAVQAFEKAAQAEGGEAVQLLVAAADIQAQLGDAAAAERLLGQALQAAKTPAARAQVAERLALRLEERGAAPAEVLRALSPLAADKEPRVLAAIGLAEVMSGRGEAAEATLQGVLGARAEAPREARARAHLGSAEALAHLIEGFAGDGSLDTLNELTALVDLLEESYLGAARDGDPLVTPTALARLSASARMAAGKLRGAALPGDLSDADRKAIQAGLAARAGQLDELAAGAITTCAAQAWSAKVWSPVVRGCLVGKALDAPRLVHDAVRPRGRRGAAPVPDALRDKLAESPDDAATIVAVGEALLDAGDPHTARLVLARAIETGGARAHNLIGVAHFEVGDHAAALEAFARAADGGLEAGRDNLRQALEALGLGAAAGEVPGRWPDAREGGGRALRAGGGGAR